MISKNSKPIRISINSKKYIYLISPKDEQTDRKLYQKKIKSVIYTAINIRPDITFTIRKLSQYVVDPVRYHEQTIKYLIQYLQLIIKHHLTYKTSKSNQIIEYTNKDYMKNYQDRKSIIKIIFLFNNDSISWLNKKQKSISILTTETEYITILFKTKQAL